MSIQEATAFLDEINYKHYVLGFSFAVYGFEQYLK